MARILPSGWRELRATGAAVRELETLALLADALPDSCTVYHGVHWTQIEHGLSAFGEIDFIIVAPSGRMLVIEQKSGVLQEGSEGIAKVYAGKAKKIPVQILRSVGALRQRYARRRRGATLFIDYLLYCPDYTVRQPEIAGIEPERIVDATRRALLPAIIESLLRLSEVESAEAEHIHRFLGKMRCRSTWLLERGWRGGNEREASACHYPATRVSVGIPRRSARCCLAESTPSRRSQTPAHKPSV